MKVPASIRGLYEDQKAVNYRLRAVVDERMKGLKDARWHYEGRVKELPSFVLKIESGRFREPEALEDFFACTLVVANAREIDAAERLVRESFTLKERRPPRAEDWRRSSRSAAFRSR